MPAPARGTDYAAAVDETAVKQGANMGCVNVNGVNTPEAKFPWQTSATDVTDDDMAQDEGMRAPQPPQARQIRTGPAPDRPGPIDLLTPEQRKRYKEDYESRSADVSPGDKHRHAWRAATNPEEREERP